MVAALAGGGVFFWRSHDRVALTGKDTVVLADFANTTGDSVFDVPLKTALMVDLSQSPFINVLSDNKVAETLKLMTQPADTKLTPEMARDVCQRAGGKAYIAGSIASLGTQYVLGLKAVNCQDGSTLAQQLVTATAKEKILGALDQATSKLRSIGIERGRASRRWRVTVLALSVCKAGSQFHRSHVSRGPPIIPDGRISQVRFEVLACRP